MAEKQLHRIVERAVAKVFDRHLPKLQAELVERVVEDLPTAAAEAASPPAAANVGTLVEAIASIHAGSTQKEILHALLDACSTRATRVALFVVKAGAATGWQARGFGDSDAVKDIPLDLSSGPPPTPVRIAWLPRETSLKWMAGSWSALAARGTSRF